MDAGGSNASRRARRGAGTAVAAALARGLAPELGSRRDVPHGPHRRRLPLARAAADREGTDLAGEARLSARRRAGGPAAGRPDPGGQRPPAARAALPGPGPGARGVRLRALLDA